jgi:hypothetical protein
LSLNTWYYVVGVYDGARPIVYVNGVVTNGGAYSPIQAETASSLIGKPQWFPGYFNGQIANIQVYNTSLDASQVQTLYQEGIGGVPVSPQYLVGWWPLNSDANDYSGNNNNGAATALTYTAQYGK